MQGAVIHIIRFFVLLMLVVTVTACTNMAITGAQAVYNHKALENSVNDQLIAFKANHVINHPRFKGTNISIAVLNNEVLLSGEVYEDQQKQRAGDLIQQIDGVKHVYNFIALGGRASSLSQTADAWVTAKVKSKIIASREIDATRIKVVTERGTVYLMGIMLPEEADQAVDIARTTDGVTSVVKLFSYMRITKT